MQQAAIDERKKTLLVSAAAGSGKTATLTERIIRSLTDPESPTNIESLLVVTFTTAAAAELKVKLTRALEQAVAKNPEDKHLSHQLYMLPSAKIRTIDSFCNDILRMGADRVGLSGGYRIADGAECELLAISVMDGLIGAVYRDELREVATAEEMEALADCLTDSKHTEELSEVLRLVYEKCESSELGVDQLLSLIELYNTEGFSGVEKTQHGSYLMEITDEMLDHYLQITDTYVKRLAGKGASAEKYAEMAECDGAAIATVLRAKTYKEKREALLGFALKTKPSSRSLTEISADMESYSALRDMLREDIKKLPDYYTYTENEWRDTMDALRSHLGVLYKFLKRFDSLFLEEKIRRRALSYSDIERLCYRCLINDGRRTDIAENLSRQYEAIYIDEYQDVNSLQNSIFSAISRPNNRFMVGDIKQSIYGFRSARPEIFAEMKSTYPEISTAAGGDCASIFMSENFRSDAGVIDFVNSVFDRVFGTVGDSIGYEQGDRLRCSKVYDGEMPPYRYPEICLTDKKEKGEDSDPSPDVVAAKIDELLRDSTLNSGERIRPSDVAIILRSARGRDTLYADALKKRGIPSKISGSKSFFLSSEVLLALCLLNVIDNPRRDIYLAGLLCSPLFDFCADDLCRIRHGGEGETLYEALLDYTSSSGDFKKGEIFLGKLDYYRTISEGMGVDALIAKLYRETGLMALAAKNGGADNLTLLYDYARNYESGAYKGLYNFIKFINGVLDKKTSFDDKRESAESDAVRIITSHSSKGLEYPVVFIVDAGKAFSAQDARSRLVYSEDMGISFRLRSPSGLAVVNSPIHDLTCHYILRRGGEEELRVLYVALTRARERLYVVGSPTSERDDYVAKMQLLSEHLTPYAIRSRRSSMDIILAATKTLPKSSEDFAPLYEPELSDTAETFDEAEFEFIEEEADDGLTDELTRRFTYEYPNKYLTVLPEKLSVSRTYPGALDVDGAVELFTEDEKPTQPAFITGRATEESAKRGIATHMFLQFCDLQKLRDGGAKRELQRLLDEGFLSQADGERVRLYEINSFTRSRLFCDMLDARHVYRELRFNVAMPAHLFTENEEQKAAYREKTVLVQGVIDCIIEYSDGTLGLFDYKTDRLTEEELSDRAKATATLSAKHSRQLSYYAHAVEKMFGKAPARVEVYSLPLGDTVPV